MTTLKTLLRLFFRQFSKERKREFIAIFVLVAYFWFIEIFSILKTGAAEKMSPSTAGTVLLVVLLLDFFLKLIQQHDNTVMDAFLKTRPIPQKLWNRFLRLSHCWEPLNLMFPLGLLPIWFFTLPFGRALLMFVASYLFSVAGGIVVMRLKRNGPYAPEKAKVHKTHDSALTGRVRMGSVGLQVKALLRSKRLMVSGLLLSASFYLYFLARVADGRSSRDAMLLVFLCVFSSLATQYGFSMEARFFNGLWTKPFPVRRLLEDKYAFSGFLTVLGGLLALPVFLFYHIPLWVLWSRMIFVAGLAPLAFLVKPFVCVPYDPFNPAHFNSAGRTQGTFNVAALLSFILMALAIALIHAFLPSDTQEYLLTGLGVAGFLARKPFFAWVERCFLRERHLYMDKYNGQ